MDSKQIKLIVLGVVVAALLVLTLVLFDIETVRGNEVGVMETWSQGVIEEPLQPKTYFLFPGFAKKIYKYPTSTQVFVMNDVPPKIERVAAGRDADAYQVQSAEGQDMFISLTVQWRLDPTKVVDIHKTVRDSIEEKLIRPQVMRIVKDEATKRKAIEAYSGEGLVRLQADIQKQMMEPTSEMSKRGVIVENFVIEKIRLDEKYINEIKLKQVAVQARLRNIEETSAAKAAADRADAMAQADLRKRVVEAERDKSVGILDAEKSARMAVLAAQAEKEKLVLEATGTRDAKLLEAEGILAIGKSEAEATKLKLSAYAVPGADVFVKIEVAKYFAEAHKNVKGYLPESMNIFTLGTNYAKAIERIVSPGAN